jgi:exoribonuclease R
MAPPDERSVVRLRLTAQAFGLDWPAATGLAAFERGLDPHDPRQAAFMLAIRRASPGASYAPYQDGVVPWHAAMAATYAHATAPLRRLADRYVIRATLAIANGQPVPDVVTEAFPRLPQVMAHGDGLSGQVDRAVIDLAEAVMLRGQEGDVFAAIVTTTDQRGLRLQLRDLPIVVTIAGQGAPGDMLNVRLTAADPERRLISFQPIDS